MLTRAWGNSRSKRVTATGTSVVRASGRNTRLGSNSKWFTEMAQDLRSWKVR